MNDIGNSHDAEKSRKLVVVNCSQTRYHVVRAAAVGLGWYVEDDNCDGVPAFFHQVPLEREMELVVKRVASRGLTYDAAKSPQILFLDKSVTFSRVAALPCYQRVNHFPGMHVVARKAVLFKRLMRIRRQMKISSSLAASLRSFPWSFSAPAELLQLERFLHDPQRQGLGEKQPFFILKPNKGCQGKGIILTSEPLQVLERKADRAGDDWLVQLYVTPPLCIERKKFDLRVYVLLTSVVVGRPPRTRRRMPLVSGGETRSSTANILDGLQLFVHEDGLVRICAEEYSAPSRSNCDRASVHLTNYAVNKRKEGFSVGTTTVKDGVDAGGAVCEGNKRDFRFLRNYVNALPTKDSSEGTAAERGDLSPWEALLRQIDMCIMLTILSGLDELQREFIGTGASRGSRSDARNCFELLGFDLMLTENLEPVLMEVNHSPSLFCDSSFDFETKRRVVMDVFRTLEPHVPSIEYCDDTSYATYQATLPATPSGGELVGGFRQISPQRTTATRTAGGGDNRDGWCEEEMRIFEEMLRHAKMR